VAYGLVTEMIQNANTRPVVDPMLGRLREETHHIAEGQRDWDFSLLTSPHYFIGCERLLGIEWSHVQIKECERGLDFALSVNDVNREFGRSTHFAPKLDVELFLSHAVRESNGQGLKSAQINLFRNPPGSSSPVRCLCLLMHGQRNPFHR
jgi:hypothetical protein